MSPGEIERRFPRQPEIVQQLGQRNAVPIERLVEWLSILLLEKFAEVLQVYVSGRGSFDRHLVRVNEIGALKHPLDLLAGRHAPLVRARL